eukprot:320607_1
MWSYRSLIPSINKCKYIHSQIDSKSSIHSLLSPLYANKIGKKHFTFPLLNRLHNRSMHQWIRNIKYYQYISSFNRSQTPIKKSSTNTIENFKTKDNTVKSAVQQGIFIVFEYYYWFIYYFMHSFSSFPKPSSDIELFSWCAVQKFKLWNLPSPDMLGLNSLGYEMMIVWVKFSNIKSRSNTKQILLKSYIYRWIYLSLLIFW